ncbi:uncharacterized protein N0V89_003577 [Didymosphaeria variabile]|uniref:RlpA-like protein double-psi beta-barrel domain-containing protein n=1 Tax=Didymosphaeria variabile TaxID=1932322 RepID=A0A9W8XNN5_9PLEO|nr:uncharacterized protein N0V89_003577 [Didymosphaeria variabile]KAJ4355559.1 hypothetical protein N0V89_003577 [Didymosphaeria variabile]
MHFILLTLLSLLTLFVTATPVPQHGNPPSLTNSSPLLQSGHSPLPAEAGILGETHTNIRFSAVDNYPFTRIKNNFGACAYAGPDSRFLENDPGSWMVSLDANVPNWGSYCGKKVRLTNPDGRTATAVIVDKCPGCSVGGAFSLDLFHAPWSKVGGRTSADNVYGAKWEIIG